MLYRSLSLALTLVLSGCSSTPSDEELKALEKEYYSQRDTVIDFDYQIFFDNGDELFIGDLSRTAGYRACIEISRDPANEKFNISCDKYGKLTYSSGPLKEHSIDYSFDESTNTLKVYQNPYPLPKHVPYLLEKLPEIKQLQQQYAEKTKNYTIENRQHWGSYLQTIDSRKKKIVEFYAGNGISVDPDTLTADNERMLDSWTRQKSNDVFESAHKSQTLDGPPYYVDKTIEKTNSHFMEWLEDNNRIEILRLNSWMAHNNSSKGYYFITNETKLPQLLVLRTHVDHCHSYNIGVTFITPIDHDFKETRSCQVKINGKTVASGPCEVTAIADINFVNIMMESNKLTRIQVKDLNVSPRAKITYKVMGSVEFSYKADDLDFKVTNLTHSCLKREDI
ncbi:hypothetical protein [Vibrio crassostreae]|uniref:hypothetical protein n=1 Tax=Vibrio crassostreae TaxID=246167 RepID=UPI0002FBAFDD|nr:hypothetical protein [Vibrio crassostreae]OED83641.1 hypothetical protein A141_19785 [Vibrio crassostreae ZF-91]